VRYAAIMDWAGRRSLLDGAAVSGGAGRRVAAGAMIGLGCTLPRSTPRCRASGGDLRSGDRGGMHVVAPAATTACREKRSRPRGRRRGSGRVHDRGSGAATARTRRLRTRSVIFRTPRPVRRWTCTVSQTPDEHANWTSGPGRRRTGRRPAVVVVRGCGGRRGRAARSFSVDERSADVAPPCRLTGVARRQPCPDRPSAERGQRSATRDMAHLHEAGHGPAFWQVPGRVMPDYDGRKRQLATRGAGLRFGGIAR
jgi:hypothetical protein